MASPRLQALTDGTLVYGSQTVTINSTIFIADDIEFDQPSKVLTRNNQLGVPQAEQLIAEVRTGKMTLQIPVATGGYVPQVGDVFTTKDVDGVTTLNWKINKIGRSFKADAETKTPIEFRQKLN